MPKETLTPDAAQEGTDLPEPTHSETRPRQAGEAIAERAHRTSVRPSAFGLPRASYSSLPPPPPEPRAPREEARTLVSAAPDTAHVPSVVTVTQPAAEFDDDETETRPSQRRLQNERSRVVDQLTVDAALGESPRVAARGPAPATAQEAPAARVASQPAPARARRPWASVALFSAMLGLSVVPLLRYALSHEPAPPAARVRALPGMQLPAAHTPSPPSTGAGTGSAAPSTATPEAGREQQLITLIAAGNRALEEGAVSDAERLFGRVVELDEDNPRAAYGLARVRLTQGNLSGAEGWIQLALRKRPRRRAYHALYAEVLMRLGRTDEAHEEERHTALTEAEDERANAQHSDTQ